MKFNRGLIGGSTDLLILFLIYNRDMYGYEIIQELELRSEGAFLFKEGTLYPILHRLEEDKYLKSYQKKGERGRARKYYKLTAEGKEFLKNEYELWQDFVGAVDKVLDIDYIEKEEEIEDLGIDKNKKKIFRKGNILF